MVNKKNVKWRKKDYSDLIANKNKLDVAAIITDRLDCIPISDYIIENDGIMKNSSIATNVTTSKSKKTKVSSTNPNCNLEKTQLNIRKDVLKNKKTIALDLWDTIGDPTLVNTDNISIAFNITSSQSINPNEIDLNKTLLEESERLKNENTIKARIATHIKKYRSAEEAHTKCMYKNESENETNSDQSNLVIKKRMKKKKTKEQILAKNHHDFIVKYRQEMKENIKLLADSDAFFNKIYKESQERQKRARLKKQYKLLESYLQQKGLNRKVRLGNRIYTSSARQLILPDLLNKSRGTLRTVPILSNNLNLKEIESTIYLKGLTEIPATRRTIKSYKRNLKTKQTIIF